MYAEQERSVAIKDHPAPIAKALALVSFGKIGGGYIIDNSLACRTTKVQGKEQRSRIVISKE